MQEQDHDHEEQWDAVGAVLVCACIVLGVLVVGRLIFQAITGH